MIPPIPQAPPVYDVRDQREFRRLVNKILRDFELRIRALEEAA